MYTLYLLLHYKWWWWWRWWVMEMERFWKRRNYVSKICCCTVPLLPTVYPMIITYRIWRTEYYIVEIVVRMEWCSCMPYIASPRPRRNNIWKKKRKLLEAIILHCFNCVWWWYCVGCVICRVCPQFGQVYKEKIRKKLELDWNWGFFLNGGQYLIIVNETMEQSRIYVFN